MMIPMITNTATNEGRAVTREDGRTGKIGETHADESFDVIFDDNGGTGYRAATTDPAEFIMRQLTAQL